MKERAAQMAAALQRAAEEQGVSLKLNKKPKPKPKQKQGDNT